MKNIILLFLCCLLSFPVCCGAQFSPPSSLVVSPEKNGWWQHQSADRKLLYTGLFASTVIGLWGAMEWDYGSAGWHNANEGWFQHDTKYGGADKLGHFWTTYVLSDGLTALYQSWGYTPTRANAYAAFSAWAIQMSMEVMDATSVSQGFSWEDSVVNTLGACTSILMQHFPALDRKIDFRVEYVFDKAPEAIFDDYSNQFYSLAVKLDGFSGLEDTFLQYFELHGGYYTRGYDERDAAEKRAFFAGVTLNFSRLFYRQGLQTTGKVLEYLQVPYSVPKVSTFLN